MVRAGTEGGFLEDALDRVGAFTELQEDLKGRTISAMAYPVFLFSVGTVVLSALLVFFVPKFDMLFDRLRSKGQMPKATEWLLSFSNFLQNYGWIAADRIRRRTRVDPHEVADRRGQRDRGSHQTENPSARQHLDEPGGGPFLPRAGNLARQRSADSKVARNQRARRPAIGC